ncbi:hypothetical protein CEXT_246891 [Caerostris extrusa]|uniref:Uncharacterized protein n=1 Tax=Caerostris extrusa TaxID=172846 RepID=A0AAV4WDM8_CAEEX|nr:hypothetical protein CEXT_246891 [Caerostris extrusa]
MYSCLAGVWTSGLKASSMNRGEKTSGEIETQTTEGARWRKIKCLPASLRHHLANKASKPSEREERRVLSQNKQASSVTGCLSMLRDPRGELLSAKKEWRRRVEKLKLKQLRERVGERLVPPASESSSGEQSL